MQNNSITDVVINHSSIQSSKTKILYNHAKYATRFLSLSSLYSFCPVTEMVRTMLQWTCNDKGFHLVALD